ncbi:MAG: hypothetical protein ACRD36_10995, partial [Candidatus Acidiferrum sp.]
MSHSARVEKYRRLIEEAESWLFSHDDAMACLDLEDHVANLVFVFERLNKLDQDSRMALFGGKVPCVPQADEAVRMCYVGWQKAAEICRLEVVRMQDKG